ncbi:MAG: hypothetical protein JWM16_414 [Verrucomicrobiales bacterium]|nr:hypothetical protein [Verrucomicrobiales bacterium]
MNTDPLTLALREIAETRGLLENLITSSESFDYPQAKLALTKLNRKVRDLARVQTKLQAQHRARFPDICMPDFGRPIKGVKESPRA